MSTTPNRIIRLFVRRPDKTARRTQCYFTRTLFRISVSVSVLVNVSEERGTKSILDYAVSKSFSEAQKSCVVSLRAVRRRRRRRPNVGVALAPFSWRVHVMFYTSYMLLDFCTVMPFTMKLEHWQKAERTTRACFLIALDTQTKYGGVKAKVFSWTVLWKWKLMLKVSHGTSLGIWLIKRMVQCNNCL